MRRRVTALSLLLVACACAGERAAPKPVAAEPLRVGIDLWPGFYGIVVAKESRIYDSLGLAMELTIPENTNAMRADFAAGRLDVIGTSLADGILLSDVAPEMRVIACTDESAGADIFAARKGISSIAQLRGKRIGLNLGSFSELLLVRMLSTAQIKESEVALVNTDAAQVPDLLRRGEIDAGETWEPYATEARANGASVLYTSAQTPGLIVDCLIARDAVVARRAPELQTFINGYFAALARMRTDSVATRQLLARALDRAPDQVNSHGVRLLDREDNRQRFEDVKAATSFRHAADEYIRFFGRRGGLRTAPSLDRLLEPRFVR